jgi:hypothetical protein
VKQEYSFPCINRYREVITVLLSKPVLLAGSKGKREVNAFFDSGASYSCISASCAQEIAHLEKLPEPMEFETAESGYTLRADYAVRVDFYFPDTPRRFTDELVVIDGLSEELVIGAATMQKWKISLDFDAEEVVYDKKMHKLRI